MTGEDVQARHRGCTKVEGSLETRQFKRDAGHSFASGRVRREDGAMMQPGEPSSWPASARTTFHVVSRRPTNPSVTRMNTGFQPNSLRSAVSRRTISSRQN